jgi:hypothetical protein
MKQLLSSCALGLALTLALAGCDRAKAPQPAAAAAAVPFQKIDTVAGTGKEALAGSTAVVNYTGCTSRRRRSSTAPCSTRRSAASPSASSLAPDGSSRAGTTACRA